MPVLVIVPNDGLRERLRQRLEGRGGSLRAQTYRYGVVLAEQNLVEAAILWIEKGASAETIEVVRALRRARRDMRIIVITPRITPAGYRVFVESQQVDAYLLDADPDAIVAEACGVPMIIERSPPTSTGGSSAASS